MAGPEHSTAENSSRSDLNLRSILKKTEIIQQTAEQIPDSSTSSENGDEKRPAYQSGWRLTLVMVAIYLCAFLIALDRTIIATAAPSITDEFSSLSDVGWYASAYLLTSCSFQLFFGKLFTFYAPKWVFLANVLLFAVGSAIAGAAPQSWVLIVGRAVAGVGAAGINSGVIIILSRIVPPKGRPMATGLLGVAFGIAAVVGPVLGGVFAHHATWRWCFWCNLPVCVFALVAAGFAYESHADTVLELPRSRQLQLLDPLGTTCFLPGIVSLLLALQWGGSTFAWSSPRIIVLLVLFGVLTVAFVGIQLWKGDDATVPPRIVRQRSIAAGALFSLTVGGSLMLLVYYLPIWFQAIQGVSALRSGISNVPLMVALVVASVLVRVLITGVGYYAPFMIAAAALMATGSGLMTTFTPDTSTSRWIGYQILYGFGVGLGMQQSTMAGLTVLEPPDIPIGMALMFFAQTLGGAVFVSVGQNVFARKLRGGLAGIDGVNAGIIAKTGATNLRKVVDEAVLPAVILAYNSALRDVFIVVTAVSALVAVGAVSMEWRSVKHKKATFEDAMG